MFRVVALAVTLALVIAARLLVPVHFVGQGALSAADATMALGFVLIVSFFAGRVAKVMGLPSITGYILTGILFGPYVLTWITPGLAVLGTETVDDLRLFDGVALGIIALTAGGELKLSLVKARAKTVAWIIVFHTVIIFAGTAGAALLAGRLIPALAGIEFPLALAAALLYGVTAVATSPSTTIAVLQECKSTGAMSEVVLAVTVLKDVVVITMFTVVFALSAMLVSSGGGFNVGVLGGLVWEVVGSIVLGVFLGFMVVVYLRHVGREVPLVVLGVAFASVVLSEEVHLSGILACMVAGFCIENFSSHGDDLIKAIERYSLPVYVVFFTIAGAGLDLDALSRTWMLALIIAGSRLLFTFVATFLGARVAGASVALQKHAWSAFIGQAGVTLGFTIIIAGRFSELGYRDFGLSIATVIVAVIAINQVLGPVVFKLGLQWAGEIPKEDGDEKEA